MNRRSFFYRTFILGLFISTLSPAWALRTRVLNLNSIIQGAHTIFEGECIQMKSGQDPESGLMATWYTFRILNGIKGELDEEYTLKQYGGRGGENEVYLATVTYEIGERVILFLYEPSRIGFSSAVGFQQGKFNIKEIEETGARYVTNGMPARILFDKEESGVSTLDEKGAKIRGENRMLSDKLDANEFVSVVKSKVREQSQAKQ